jgi:hypothetical protein
MRHRLTALALIIPAALAGCNYGHPEQSTFTWNGPIDTGHWVHLRNMSGDILVEPTSAPEVRVTAIQSRHAGSAPARIIETGANGDIVICTMYSGGGICSADGYKTKGARHWFRFFGSSSGNPAVRYTVQVPVGVKIDLSTVSGDIRVTGAGDAVIARTVSGDVQASTTKGSVIAHSVNGDVVARVDSLINGNIEVSTINGDAVAELPQQVDGNVEVQTVNGDIQTDYQLTTTTAGGPLHHLRATLGAGGREIQLKTVNGDVMLRKVRS